MQQSELLIVILCYRVVDLTIDCLRSLASQIDDVPGTHVAVCENGSGPKTVLQLNDAIEQYGWGTWVTVTPVFPNCGFAGGNNVILQVSKSQFKYFLLLNSDTIVRPGALRHLVDAAQRYPRAG